MNVSRTAFGGHPDAALEGGCPSANQAGGGSRMIRRRDFIAGLGSVAACPRATPAQEQVRRVGVLLFSAEEDPVTQTRVAALREGLEAAGWMEGRNLQIDYRFGAADAAQLRSHADELVRSAPDVIVTGAAPATNTVQQLTQTIPIVFVEATNEVGYGVARSLMRPEGNATGITNLYLTIGTRWLELLREAAPRVTRIALLFNPEFDSRSYIAAIEASAAAYDVKAVRTPARSAEEIERAIATFAAEPNGGLLVVPPSPSFANVQLIFRLATQYRMPAIYPTRGFAAEGGLMAYGPVSADLFRNAATYVDRILRGAKPSELPVQFLTRFELVVNLKVARAIGLEIPRDLIARAAEVIQ
jgi:putative ABC transport system substrate-binding protein